MLALNLLKRKNGVNPKGPVDKLLRIQIILENLFLLVI